MYRIVVITKTERNDKARTSRLDSPESQPCIDIRRNSRFTFFDWVDYRIYPDWCI